MAAGNVAIEAVRGQSIFAFEDLAPLATWHLSLWVVIGLIGGSIAGASAPFRRPSGRLSLARTAFVYTYAALWVLIQGYLNIYVFAGVFDAGSLVVNGLLLAIGGGLLGLRLRRQSRRPPGRRSLWARTVFGTAGLVSLGSLAVMIGASRPSFESSAAPSGPAAPSSVNVVLIVWDAVRADHVGCYGYPRETTPRLDELAARGVLFENAIAHSSHTKESVPALLTSLLPAGHNVKAITDALPRNLVLLPQVFRAAAYRTAAFSFNPYISPAFGYDRGFNVFLAPSDEFIKINKTVFGHLLELSRRIPLIGRLTFGLLELTRTVLFSERSLRSTDAETITAEALRWVDRNPRKPFFLYLHYEGGHAPYIAPDEFARLFDPEAEAEPPLVHPETVGLFLPVQTGAPLSEPETERLIARYDAKIRFHDEQLGRLVGHLDRLGIGDQTLVVVCADHGEDFYDHGGWGHGHSLFEEVIRVPLVVSLPGRLPPGRRLSGVVGLADLFPTILALCELTADLPYETAGKDLTGLITGEAPPNGGAPADGEERFVLSELTQGRNFAQSLRGDRHKLIVTEAGGDRSVMLFDLAADPGERRDIAAEEPGLTARLLERLRVEVARASQRSFRPRRMPMDEQDRKVLRSLGYIK